MANKILFFISSLLIILAIFTQKIYAVNYLSSDDITIDVDGGFRFYREAGGFEYTKRTLEAATSFIWRTFEQHSPADRKNVNTILLALQDMSGLVEAYSTQSAFNDLARIATSARYMQIYKGDLKREITGLLYRECARIWQWNGNGQASYGLTDGIANYVRLKADLAPIGDFRWKKRGQGDRWDQGGSVTAHFLCYCDSLRSGFVGQLTKRMRYDYSDELFVHLLGRSVNQLWMDYKAKYGRADCDSLFVLT